MTFRQTAAVSAAFALIIHVAGCDRPAAVPRERAAQATEAVPSATPAAAETSAKPLPEPAPAPQAFQSRDPDAVLRGWAAAIERRDWAGVRGLWGNEGADSGLSTADFAARWDKLKAPRVHIGPGEQEGAAGSLYYTAPVSVVDGARTVSGKVVLRRVNDVPGATAEQLRWHLEQGTRAPWTKPG